MADVAAGERAPQRRRKSKSILSQMPLPFGMEEEWKQIALEVEEFLSERNENSKTTNGLLIFGFFVMSVLSLFLTSFLMLIPLMHGVGGRLMYRKDGWKFYQPGVGGTRFVALNGAAWTLYAVTIVLQVALFAASDITARLVAFLTGFLSFTFMFSSLMTYQPPGKERNRGVQVAHYLDFAAEEWDIDEEDEYTPVFNKELEQGYLTNQAGTGPNAFWWIFIGLNLGLSGITSILTIIASNRIAPLQILTAAIGLVVFISVVSITNALGGKWFHISSNFAAFQPGVGGFWFVLYQAIGWSVFAISLLVGIGSIVAAATMKDSPVPGLLLTVFSLLSFATEVIIVASLFEYEEDTELYKRRKAEKGIWSSIISSALQLVEDSQRWFFDVTFGLKIDREITEMDPEAYKRCEEKWERLTANCPTTNDTYLVVGVGFVGKRLVQRLLDRGETNIRLFDIAPHNPFEGDERVTFYRGDVTKIDDISKACEGVHTVYATFAVIRFSDRLDYQAGFSYHINVNGTKVLFEAVKMHNVPRVIVTSSSHATTDEESQPRLGRDETAPYVTRETAHNHYGWTKAMADKYALKKNGSELANGEKLQVVIVRPCSGIFGGDDKIQFERFFLMGIGPCMNAKYVIDWTYVENIVLGHLLAEARMQDNTPGVAGEAFCISNGDAISMPNFFYLCKQHLKRQPKEIRDRLSLQLVFVPMTPMWAIAYLSETIQRLTGGKLKLPKSFAEFTPPTLQTGILNYSYKNDKAEKILGYEPAYTVEEAIQQSIVDFYNIQYGATKED